MKKLILFLIIIAGITEGCQKYEEGPWLSLRSAEKRLYGNYTLKQYTVNGVHSLSLFYDSLGLNFEISYDDVNSLNIFKIDGKRKDGHYYPVICTWQLINNNKVLEIKTAYAYTGTGPFGNNITPEWEILRLTNNEIKLRTYYNNKEYIINL